MILLLGDVHGQYDEITAQLAHAMQLFQINHIVQAGDLGVEPPFLDLFPEFDIPFYFVCGNHENHKYLRKLTKGSLTTVEIRENVFYVPRGATFEIDGLKWVGVGGCEKFELVNRDESIDAYNCPPGSVLKPKQVQRGCQQNTADIILTHDAPFGLGIKGSSSFRGGFDVGAEKLLPLYDLEPKLWFFGHYHNLISIEGRETQHHCLDCCCEGYGLLEGLEFGWRSNCL